MFNDILHFRSTSDNSFPTLNFEIKMT
jgi:hypothetical protein